MGTWSRQDLICLVSIEMSTSPCENLNKQRLLKGAKAVFWLFLRQRTLRIPRQCHLLLPKRKESVLPRPPTENDTFRNTPNAFGTHQGAGKTVARRLKGCVLVHCRHKGPCALQNSVDSLFEKRSICFALFSKRKD